MKRKTVISLGFIFFCICFPNVTFANKYEIDGLELDLMWKTKNEQMIIWGDVEGNRDCNEINITVYFQNRKMKGGLDVQASTLRQHKPGDRSPFRGERDIYTRENLNSWFLKDISINCY